MMKYRLPLLAILFTVGAVLLFFNVAPDSGLVIVLFHTLLAATVYLILLICRMNWRIAAVISFLFLFSILLFVFKLLSIENLLLLCAIVFVGYVYGHTK